MAILKLEKQLNLDPEGFLLASILAKKAAVCSTHVLIDIPIGKEAKLKTKHQARELGKKFVKIGKKLNMKVRYVAFEAIGQLVDLMNNYFAKYKIKGKAFHFSLFDSYYFVNF